MQNTEKLRAGLERAITAAGNQRKLAAILGVTPQAISQWDCVPISRVPRVAEATGVPRHVLRPDFYEAEAAA